MRLSEASDAYLSFCRQMGYSIHTIKGYRLQLSVLIRDIGDLDIDEITLQKLREHLSYHSNLKASSVAHKVKAIRSLFRWLIEEEFLQRSPALKLRSPKEPKLLPKSLTVEEIESLRDACKTPLEHALIEFFFATGARLSEVCGINRADIDWSRQSVIVYGKGSREREVYFGAKAAIWVRRYLSGRKDNDDALFVTENKPHRTTPATIQRRFKQVAARCGLEAKVSPHRLRHSLATTLINQGAPIAAVQSLLGHAKPDTTMRYIHLSGATRQQVYQRYFVQ